MSAPTLIERLRLQLAELERDALLRNRRTLASPCGPEVVVDGRPLLAFASNDYLGLANHPALAAAAQAGAARWGTGAGAAHLVSGHQTPHHALEEALACFVQRPRALYFSTGYMANTGVIPALVGRGDAVFADRLNHASLIDGMLISRADFVRYPHNDMGALEAALAKSTARTKLIAVDAVFSMDGDLAPLPRLLELAERHDAWLYADDAHGFGVLGPQGRGTAAHFGLHAQRLILMGTLGKAAGVSGAFVAGANEVVEWLLQRARTYVFTTASPPLVANALLAALPLIEQGDDRRAHLRQLIAQLRAHLPAGPWRLLPSETAIQPLVIGGNAETLRIAQGLLEQGIWVPAIRPPTVPKGEARLRITLSAAHTAEQVARLCAALGELA